MKTFILLMLVSVTGTSGGVSVATTEFNSLEQCQKAATAVQKEFNTIMTFEPKTICLEK